MDVKAIIMSLFRGKSGDDGVWDFLSKRAAGKSRVSLEQLRNEGTREAIRILPRGAVLREGGQEWVREIWMPGAAILAEGDPGRCIPASIDQLMRLQLDFNSIQRPVTRTGLRGEPR
jgi:hypothetical protein